MKSCFSYEQLLEITCSLLLSGASEQDWLLSDFNHMLMVVFVLVTESKHRSLKYASQTELHG